MGSEYRYLDRDDAARSYREARARARALKPTSWKHYLALAKEHGLPTQPQSLWPKQWEEGGRYAGFLGVGVDEATIADRNLISAMEIRERLGIGHATWKLITSDIKPAAAVRHKVYYDPTKLTVQLLERIDRIRRSDAREQLKRALGAWLETPSDR